MLSTNLDMLPTDLNMLFAYLENLAIQNVNRNICIGFFINLVSLPAIWTIW